MTRSKVEATCSIEPQTEIEAGADLTCMFNILLSLQVALKCQIIDVYTLIHSFLKERSHTKAASALKRAVGGAITIDDGTQYNGPTLQKILKEWRELKATANAMCVQ